MKKNTILFLCLFLSTIGYGQLIINEVLYDPPSGLIGDANGDGVRSASEDEFIEFVNFGAFNFNISGYEIWDDTANGKLRFVFPPNTLIPPFGSAVVFGGGSPTGHFGNALVFTSDSFGSLSFNNSGEEIIIKDAFGFPVLSFDIDSLPNSPDESFTRFPDFTGPYLQHNQEAGYSTLFSPGTKGDGTHFDSLLIMESILVQGQSGANRISTPGGTLQMEAITYPTNVGDSTVTWSVPASNTVASIDSNGLLSAIGNGSVIVTATANDGSGITGWDTIFVSEQATSLSQISVFEIEIYPNPARDFLRFTKPANYRIFDMQGVHVAKGYERSEIDVSSLPKGLYIVQFTDPSFLTKTLKKLYIE